MGCTPIHVAAQCGHHQVVEMLLASGANKDAATNMGCTPIYEAALNGRHQVVEMLLAAGANKDAQSKIIDAKTKNKSTPISIAALIRGHHQLVELLSYPPTPSSVSKNE